MEIWWPNEPRVKNCKNAGLFSRRRCRDRPLGQQRNRHGEEVREEHPFEDGEGHRELTRHRGQGERDDDPVHALPRGDGQAQVGGGGQRAAPGAAGQNDGLRFHFPRACFDSHDAIAATQEREHLRSRHERGAAHSRRVRVAQREPERVDGAAM